MSQQKAKKGHSLGSAVKQEDIIQAVLLPLVNRPLLEYSLEFLNNSGIDETFIFSCSHWQQIKQFVNDSQFMATNSSMTVSVFASETFQSFGDVLRELDRKAIIKSDFILINGDSIGNLPLKQIRDEHKNNRLRDKGCVMTTVFRRAKPNHRIRSIEDEFVTALESETNKILYFERIVNNRKFEIPLSKFQDNQSVDIHYDLQDTHLSICSVNVPPLFADNFDYETRDDFIDGILVHEELLGNYIYAYITDTGYCARVNNISSYDRISRDILQRFTYPTVPDMQNMCTYQRHNIYKRNGVQLDVDTIIKENVAIGTGSVFGSKTFITNSTVGSNCRIGNNVKIEDSYIWDNVVIEDNCVINKSIIADNVHIKPNVVINTGSLISYNVILGPNIELKKLSRIFYDSNEDNESFDKSIVGVEGKGYDYKEKVESDNDSTDGHNSEYEIWGETDDENEDEDKYTTSSVFSERTTDEERDLTPVPDELKSKECLNLFLYINSYSALKVFYDEVYDSLQRGIDERVNCENLILEINSSKHAYNIPMKDLNVLVMKAILELPDSTGAQSAYFAKLKPILNHLLPLIQNYIKSKESQNDCITSIEEYSLLNDKRINDLVFVKLINHLYDKEILKEDIIIDWHRNARPLTEFDIKEQQQLRAQKPIQGFIKWLEEAEEESSD